MDGSQTVSIRFAEEADLDIVQDLWAELVDYHCQVDDRFWKEAPDGREQFSQVMKGSISAEDRIFLVAECSGEIVGYAHARITHSPPVMEKRVCGYITDLVVAASHRRLGIGRRLVDTLISWFREQGAQELLLDTAVRNEASCAFWTEIGFTPWTYIMWRSIE